MSSPLETRAANASILGYHYQLDKALLEIFSSKIAGAQVTVEGVEDVDVNAEGIHKAIQCKYYEAQKGTPSTLRKPIQSMLLEFKADLKKNWAFHLYVYYGHTSKLPTLTLITLKSILTYKEAKVTRRFHEDNCFSDDELERFLKHFTLTPGPSHVDQQKQLHKAISAHFSSTPVETANFYYPKSLAVVLGIATKLSREQRTVKPADVLKEIKHASIAITTPWLVRMLGTEKAYQFIQRTLKHASLFSSTRDRSVIIDLDEARGPGLVQMTLADFIEKLALHSFCVGKTLWSAKPWTVIVNTRIEELTQTKQQLLKQGIVFNDGYELVQFTPKVFTDTPIINRHSVREKPSNKIGRASYTIRLVSFHAAAPYLNDLSLGDSLICVSDPDVQSKVSAACGTKVNIGGEWSRSMILSLIAR
ncbi:hypothetical protein HDF16_005771 [Granulicella aggregans]|uniref:Uncharacterized protein n=1 Tax=Granulicella aggregans TaxID=474949 RepID=A0A7W7ZJE2_9BACT|nr:hypothetical protein [Granulicella aggregans]MBB5061035.1 hypothetical protein [Granulicella aggregans]